MYALTSGIFATLCLVSAALFLHSFKRTHDRLFVFFAAAFVVLGFSQLALGLLDRPEADLPLVYVPRLISALLIVAAIVDKNRATRKKGAALRLLRGGKPNNHPQPQRHAIRGRA